MLLDPDDPIVVYVVLDDIVLVHMYIRTSFIPRCCKMYISEKYFRNSDI